MSEGLYDEDGIDGPFERRMALAMREDARRAGKGCGERMLTPKEARERGFQIDMTRYPWLAYRGPRFTPEVLEHLPGFHPEPPEECLTDVEANLFEAIGNLVAAASAALPVRPEECLTDVEANLFEAIGNLVAAASAALPVRPDFGLDELLRVMGVAQTKAPR